MIFYLQHKESSMTTYGNYIFKFFMSIVILVTLSGCVSHNLIAEIPSMHSGSPLKGISPRIFAVRDFSDARGVDPFEFMQNMGAHVYRLNQPVSKIVTEAICKELVRNGHKCGPAATESGSDFTIEGSVVQYWYDIGVVHYGRQPSALVVVAMVLRPSAGKEKQAYTKTYIGRYVYDGGGGVYEDTDIAEIMNQALLRMVSEFSTDSELIDFMAH
jgi:hypothetical protein